MLVIIGSGFLTKRFNSTKPSPISKKEIDNLNKQRLFKADQHLQTITQPNDIKKQLASEQNA